MEKKSLNSENLDKQQENQSIEQSNQKIEENAKNIDSSTSTIEENKTVNSQEQYSDDEFDKAFEIINQEVDQNTASAMAHLSQLQKKPKKLSPTQMDKILNSSMTDEKKIILLKMLNDKDPQKTLGNSYRKEINQMIEKHETGKAEQLVQDKAKKKTQSMAGVAGLIKEATRISVD